MHEAIKNYDEGDQFSNFVNFFQTNVRTVHVCMLIMTTACFHAVQMLRV